MNVSVGDRIRIHGRVVGSGDRLGQVIEVRDDLLVVRYDDGHARGRRRPVSGG
jgi:hypothetical protein